MGRFLCDYCDVFLSHDSVSVRKQHMDGNRHRQAVSQFYQQFVGRETQEKIDRIVEEFEQKVASGLVTPTYGVSSIHGIPVDGVAAMFAAKMEKKANGAVNIADGIARGTFDVGSVPAPISEAIPQSLNTSNGQEVGLEGKPVDVPEEQTDAGESGKLAGAVQPVATAVANLDVAIDGSGGGEIITSSEGQEIVQQEMPVSLPGAEKEANPTSSDAAALPTEVADGSDGSDMDVE